MKRLICALALPLFFSQLFSQNIQVDVFPVKKFYEKYYADAISHQFSLSKHLESTEWNGNIGAQFPLFNFKIDSSSFQISVGATVYNTLIKTPGHVQVFTVDYLVDFYADYKLTENLIARFIWGHLSAHFSDDGITQLNYQPVSYVRDYAGFHTQYLLPEINGKVYVGGFYNFHNEPEVGRHFTYQIGCDAGYPLFKDFFVYAAVDIKIKSEVNYGTTRSFQAGFRYPNSNKYSFRLAYTHRAGFEERGQLYNISKNKNFLGFYFDF